MGSQCQFYLRVKNNDTCLVCHSATDVVHHPQWEYRAFRSPRLVDAEVRLTEDEMSKYTFHYGDSSQRWYAVANTPDPNQEAGLRGYEAVKDNDELCNRTEAVEVTGVLDCTRLYVQRFTKTTENWLLCSDACSSNPSCTNWAWSTNAGDGKCVLMHSPPGLPHHHSAPFGSETWLAGLRADDPDEYGESSYKIAAARVYNTIWSELLMQRIHAETIQWADDIGKNTISNIYSTEPLPISYYSLFVGTSTLLGEMAALQFRAEHPVRTRCGLQNRILFPESIESKGGW
jgi:hypothetical protein